MSSNAQLSDEELNVHMMQLDKMLDEVRDEPNMPDKKKKESEARRFMKKVRTSLIAFRTEVNGMGDPTQKSVFKRKYDEYDAQLKQIDKALRLQTHPPKVDKKHQRMTHDEELMGVGGEDGSGFRDANQVLEAGVRTYDDAIQSLQRSERLVHSAEDTGQATMVELQKQTETISRVDDELNVIDSTLNRVKKDLMWFARNMAGDKCFLCLFLIVVLALVVLVFWKVYDGRKNGGDNPRETAAPIEGTQAVTQSSGPISPPPTTPPPAPLDTTLAPVVNETNAPLKTTAAPRVTTTALATTSAVPTTTSGVPAMTLPPETTTSEAPATTAEATSAAPETTPAPVTTAAPTQAPPEPTTTTEPTSTAAPPLVTMTLPTLRKLRAERKSQRRSLG